MGEVAKFERNNRIVGAPHDLDAEMGLLGAIMYENANLEQVDDLITEAVFHEPLHGRIYAALRTLVGSGRRADPVTVKHALGEEQGLRDVGGIDYLNDLVEATTAYRLCNDYANVLKELWQRRELIRIGESIARQARGGEAASKLIESGERDLMGLQMSNRTIALVGADEAIDRVTYQLDNPSASFGVKLGLDPIDEVTGGMMPGELWLVAGRPGSGKSAIASSSALHVATHGWSPDGERLGVIEICCEMTVEQMMRRHVSDRAFEMFGAPAPSYSTIRKRAMSREQRQMFDAAAGELRTLGTLKSIYRTGLNVAGIRSVVRRQKSAWSRVGVKLGLVIVDHVGLIRATAAPRGRSEAQGEVAREMKELPGEFEAPVLALVQLNRKVEERDDKRPMLSDLRDSGEWEENADGVIGVYREAYYASREPEPKRHDLKLLWDERRSSVMIDAILMKIREGQMQTVKLWTDMGRNAIRGYQPENSLYVPSAPLIDLLDPDQALPPTTARDFGQLDALEFS